MPAKKSAANLTQPDNITLIDDALAYLRTFLERELHLRQRLAANTGTISQADDLAAARTALKHLDRVTKFIDAHPRVRGDRT